MKKIVIIGPESTGKTWLCEQLAAHFKSPWLPEYAREYLVTNGKEYAYEDLVKIAQGQLGQEDKLTPASNSLLFIDTDLYVIKVWSEFVFNRCDSRILNGIVNREYDLYLLCKPDIPWVKDELREYPNLYEREKLFHYYHDALINQSVPWLLIEGDFDHRFEKARKAVAKLNA